jgi:hypothetical protein
MDCAARMSAMEAHPSVKGTVLQDIQGAFSIWIDRSSPIEDLN